MERICNMLVESLVRVLVLHDAETGAHTRRVARLTVKLARAYGFPTGSIPHLYRGALLHDVGKICVPRRILEKKAPLTHQERDIIYRHPANVYKALCSVPYLRPALAIPYCHHEKWDGSGYPRGLSGNEIPLEARLFAVIDVWDALTSDRPYRPALTEKQAWQYICLQKGRHFQAEIVYAFLNGFLSARAGFQDTMPVSVSQELALIPYPGTD